MKRVLQHRGQIGSNGNCSLQWTKAYQIKVIRNSIFNAKWVPKLYHNDPKFSDRLVWANSADPDQTAPTGAV